MAMLKGLRIALAMLSLLIAVTGASAQTPVSRFVLPYQTVIDSTGTPLAGAYLYFYASGTNTPLNTYADSGLTVPNSNPVVANASGVFPNIFLNGTYKVVLENSLFQQIWSADPVSSVTASSAVASFTPGTTTIIGGNPPCVLMNSIGTTSACEQNPDLGAGAQLTEIANASSTGTTANKLAKLTGAPATAVITATFDTNGAIGVVIGGAGTSGNAQIAVSGQVSCAFDGATTAGDYVQISGSVSGDCEDAGASYPTNGQVVGRVLSTNASAGTRGMVIFPPQIVASSGGGGGGSPGGSTNAVQYNCTGTFCGTNIQNNGVLVTNNSALPQVMTALPNGITGTTQTSTDNTTLLATDAFVQGVVAGGTGPVSSVFGRTGAVVATPGDYTAAQVTNALSALNNLSDVSNVSTARTNLGLGTFATQNFATPPVIGGGTPNSASFTTLTTNSTTNIVTGPFQIAGNTMTFPTVAATIGFVVGGTSAGHCVQWATGPVGGLADAGAACGSGGGGGGSAVFVQDFVAPGNFTPGVTTSLTLSSVPASSAALSIFFDLGNQSADTWSVNLTTGVVTFDNPIPLGVQVVEAKWFSVSIAGGTVSSVAVNSGNGFAGTVSNPTTTPGITLSTTITGYLQGNGTAISAATANANTMLGNWTGSSGTVIANPMGACADTSGNHLNYVSGTGITCGTSTSGITALTGDVTASGTGSVAATISANAVSYAKFVQPTADSLVGNPTGSTANAENITLGSTLGFSGTTINCTTATSSQIGCSKPDGTSITISAGVLSVVGSPATSISASGGTTVTGGTNGNCLVITAGAVGNQSCGTATSIADGTTNITSGVSGSLLSNSGGVLSHETQITFAQAAKYSQFTATLAMLNLGAL